MNQDNRRSAVSTYLVMICTLASRILGFVKQAAIGAFFGAGGQADVIHLVFNIPNNLRKLLAEGALSTAFIPELSRELTRDSTGSSARTLARMILGVQIAIIIPILIFALIFPEISLSLFERFSDPDKRGLSIVLFRWMMPYLLLVSISAVMMAVHNTHDRFFIPAVTPILFSISVIASIVIGHQVWGAQVIGLGVLTGGLAQILFQLPTYRRLGYRLLPSFNFRDPAFLGVMKRWVPILITSSLFALNSQVAMLLASWLPDKSTSSLANAVVFFQLPFGIFSASITTVLYPKMSRQAASGDNGGLMESLAFGYRNLWALLLPSAAVLMILGGPIVAVAFQRRAFTIDDTLMTARVLTAYSAGMPFVGLFNITQRAMYSLGHVRKPFYCALATVVVDILASLISVFIFRMGSEGLAWANSLAFLFGAILQFIVIRRMTGFGLKGHTLTTFGRVTLATAAAAVLMYGSTLVLGDRWWSIGSSWSGLAILLGVAFAAALVILGLYVWMKVEAVSIIFRKGGKGIAESEHDQT